MTDTATTQMTDTAAPTADTATTSTRFLNPAAIATTEPVAVMAMVRASLYTFLISRNIDAPTVGVLCALSELAFTYVTRRLVVPVKRANAQLVAARDETPTRTEPAQPT